MNLVFGGHRGLQSQWTEDKTPLLSPVPPKAVVEWIPTTTHDTAESICLSSDHLVNT